jgi:hypothetical protein
LRLLESNLSSEASFVIKCKEIGHHICFNDCSYPGNSNRLELLLLSGYVFRKIQNSIEPGGGPLNKVTDALLAEVLKEYFETEIGSFTDQLKQSEALKYKRVKIVKLFLKMLVDKNVQRHSLNLDNFLINNVALSSS